VLGDDPAAAAALRCLDPRTGAGLTLAFDDTAQPGRRFEIMYRAEPRGRGE
jgi:hypothetical protein